jgi:hypothetical protein
LGALGAAALLAACISQGSGQHSATTASPKPATTAAACRLPVIVRRFEPATGTWSADQTGFLTYPNGGFMATNGTGVRYEARRDRWLPAGLPTPDGLAYLYTDYVTGVHRVALDSGADQVIVPGSWETVGFVGNRLYLAEARPVEPNAYDGGGYLVGRLFQTGALGGNPTPVTQHDGPWWVSTLGAWTIDRADGLRYAPDRILHLDLATSVLEPWLANVPLVLPVGFDAAGHPFVVSDQETVRIQLLMSKGVGRELYRGPREVGWPESPAFIDGDRVWFSGFSPTSPTLEAPVWLYQPRVGLSPSVGVPGAQVSVAGRCT